MMRVKINLATLLVVLLSTTATWAEQTVTVAPTANGQVEITKDLPIASPWVFVRVVPDRGYGIHKSDIIVEATINPGAAQAPARAAAGGPQVHYYINLEGEQPPEISMEATYMFLMPDEPLNVLVTATFTELEYTRVGDLPTDARIVSTEYISTSGHRSAQPFAGLNIVVTTYDNGSRRVAKTLIR